MISTDNGTEALELMDLDGISCVFMDVEMVGMSGVDTVQARRRAEEYENKSHMEIIALTGHIHKNEELIASGFDQVYTKPISKNDLADILALT